MVFFKNPAMSQRMFNPIDELIMGFDKAVSAIFTENRRPARTNPASDEEEQPLAQSEKRHSAGLMRVNHAGEVAAQALYSGQAFVAKDPGVRHSLQHAAAEESDHLHWCEERVMELNSHVSYLSPVWYTGSFAIGALAGLLGDRWNLGFVLETERQVVAHLDKHLEKLPENDHKSRQILEQMREDELTHATNALAAGASELPRPIKVTMEYCSRVMTSTAYWI